VTNELGILIIGLGEEEFDKRDIVLHARNANNNYHDFIWISEFNPYHLALRYVLLLPNEEFGWRPDIELRGNAEAESADWEVYGIVREEELLNQQRARNPITARKGSKHVSLKMWHAYHIHECVGVKSLVHYGGRLFQEWVVDAAAVNEQNNLE